MSLKTCEIIIEKLKDTNFEDELSICDKASLYLLNECLNTVYHVNSDEISSALLKITSLIDFATEKLHAYPYKDVPLCWRRLYTDASIVKSLCEIFIALRTEKEKESWKNIVKTLDMALVMTGAPGNGRKEMIFHLIKEVENTIKNIDKENNREFNNITESLAKRRIDDNERKNDFEKRIKLENTNLPTIRFPISKLSSPSLTTFTSRVNTLDPRPIILTSCISHWPALSTNPWADFDYLLSVTGKERIVPVEIGAKYTDNSWTQKLMNFEEFMEKWIKNPTNDRGIAYLAQHDLFAQIPRLKEDIIIPDYCFVDTKPYFTYNHVQYTPPPDVIINAWFGPQGTISPMHTDPYHNLLAQIVGSKYIRLYAPSETSKVYPFEQDGFLGNTSQVEIETPDLESFPLFASANYLECVLEPGDMLYIPPGWWHYVRSLTISFSVSFWF